MTQYRIVANDFTNKYGEYYSEFHHFPVGTLVEMACDDGTDTPHFVAVSGPDIGCGQFVPYACLEAI